MGFNYQMLELLRYFSIHSVPKTTTTIQTLTLLTTTITSWTTFALLLSLKVSKAKNSQTWNSLIILKSNTLMDSTLTCKKTAQIASNARLKAFKMTSSVTPARVHKFSSSTIKNSISFRWQNCSNNSTIFSLIPR